MSIYDELIANAEKDLESAKQRLELLRQLKASYEASEFVSAKEAAERLGISVQSVIIWLENGRLKGRKPGKKWLVSVDSIRRCVG